MSRHAAKTQLAEFESAAFAAPKLAKPRARALSAKKPRKRRRGGGGVQGGALVQADPLAQLRKELRQPDRTARTVQRLRRETKLGRQARALQVTSLYGSTSRATL